MIMNTERKGFTLLELLLYMGLVAVLSLIVGSSFIALNQGRLRAESRAEVNSTLRFVFERIKQDLRDAQFIYTPVSGASSSSLSLAINSQIITYDVSANRVRRAVDSGTPVELTPSTVNITSFSFENYQNVNIPLLRVAASIRVLMVGTYNTTDPNKTYTQTRQATFSIGRMLTITRPPGGGTQPGGLPPIVPPGIPIPDNAIYCNPSVCPDDPLPGVINIR